jgi:squalene-hopene/tetraprenyl-beta-curcumene cyclase
MIRLTAVFVLAWIAVGQLAAADTPEAETQAAPAQSSAGPTNQASQIERTTYDRMVSRAIGFLSSRQNPDGSYSPEAGPGVTALVTTALLRQGRSPDDPVVARSLAYLQRLVQPSGGIHAPESQYRNYETCLAVMCLSQANQDGRYQDLLRRADAYLKEIQWDQGEGVESADPAFGGAGYGSHNRPDLSNTSFLIEALHAVGNDADSEAMQRALIFVSRCQNLASSHNETPFATKVQDGGFYYTPAAGGTSQAGPTADGGLRSYGSMTYAGLKSMIFAGVDANDARVKAAVQWIGKNYDLRTNPGMGDAGLYYYYHTFAKALEALQLDVFVDQAGQSHRWRDELNAELARRQQADGSWINENQRWLEANPDLVTGYVLLALSYTRPAD